MRALSGEKVGMTGAEWSPRPATLVALYAALFVAVCLPLFSVETLPLSDVPNHLARIYILDHLDSDATLRQYYAANWRLFSYQSTDLILPWLTRVIGLSTGLQVFTAATFALLLGGSIAIHHVLFRESGLWPACVFLFLYNFPLTGGQVSFLFTTGLALLLFAAWLATARVTALWRVPLFIAASFVLMLCHFFVFSAYALLVMCFASAQAWRVPAMGQRIRILVEAGLPFVVPAVCFLMSFGATITGDTDWGSLARKTIVLLSPVMTYGGWPDIVLALGVMAGLWWLNRRKAIGLAPEMRLPAYGLVLAAIVMPRLLQGVHAADMRLPTILAFLLVGASAVRLGSRRRWLVLAAGIFVLVGVRVGSTMLEWRRIDADFREFRAADVLLDRGSRVTVIPMGDDFRPEPTPTVTYWYIACLAVIDRQVFMPLLYTAATPLELTAAGKALDGNEPARGRRVPLWRPVDPPFAGTDPETLRQVQWAAQRMSDDDTYTSRIDWSDWPERFDYVVDFHLGRPGNPVPSLLTEVKVGSYFTIYKIHAPQRP